MSKIRAVLLVPEEGDPLGLLAEGPCDSRPPTATRFECGWLSGRPSPHHSERALGVLSRALVLAWDGEPVAEGIDRLGRAPCVTRGWAYMVTLIALGKCVDDVDALAEPEFPGTLVLLDADGKEVTP